MLRARVGDRLAVGWLGGRLGTGRVAALSETALELELSPGGEPPPPAPVTLAVALPRPPSLRKVLQGATAMGVKRFALFHAARVEKSYWQSRELAPDALRRQCLLGLEQAGDTILPEVEVVRRFRTFAEERLPAWLASSRGLVAHPEGSEPCPSQVPGALTLVVGPEGGLVPHEIARLRDAGAEIVHLGSRRLRVENAVVALLARVAL